MTAHDLRTLRCDLNGQQWVDLTDGSTHAFTRNRIPGDLPAGKIYWGQTRPGQDPSARETLYGQMLGLGKPKKVNIFHNYTSSSTSAQSDINNVVANTLSKGEAAFYDVKPPTGYTFAQIGAGSCDAWINNLIGWLDALNKPVFLSVYDEPYGDGLGNGADFIAMQRRIRSFISSTSKVVLAPILEAVVFDHTLNGNGQPLAGAQNDPHDWYDPDVSMAWALNGYNHWATTKPDWRWHTPEQAYGYVFDAFDDMDPGKPKLIPEWGVHTDPANPGRAAQWMQDFFDYCLERGVIAAMFFDSDNEVNDGGPEWTLDYSGDGTDGSERIDKFVELLNRPECVYPTWS